MIHERCCEKAGKEPEKEETPLGVLHLRERGPFLLAMQLRIPDLPGVLRGERLGPDVQ